MDNKKLARKLIKIARILISQEEETAEIKNRRRKKVEALRNLATHIHKLRRKLTKDLGSENSKTKLTALVISIMDKTAERVGNEESAKNDHVGVTGFKKKNISVEGNTIHFKYVGKSGVKHEKQLTDKNISKMVKECLERTEKDNDSVFTTSDGFKIKADRVNRYLKEYNVKAKDIRGYAANRLVVDMLESTKTLTDEKERAKRFKEVIKSVAERVGHGAATLKTHYLLPNVENNYVKKGKIVNIKDASIEELEGN